MLKRRILAALLAATAMLGAILATSPASADDDSASSGSLTVSWLPQDQPQQIIAGELATSRFWVTNTSPESIDVVIDPGIALPGDDGSLEVTGGQDPRFPKVTFTPSEFSIAAGQTVEVKATVLSPVDLPPGVYLLPAVVRPDEPLQEGNVQVRHAIVALTTFQLPGDVDIDLAATLAPAPAPGSLVRELPFLPTIVIGDVGTAVLEVRSDSSAGIFAYFEAIAENSGIGRIAFDDHVDGAPDDVRGLPQIYFPGTSRAHPLGWSAPPFTVGAATFIATVSFNPDPLTVGTVEARASFIVVSPWWVVVVLAALAAILIGLERRLRRAERALRANQESSGARARRRASALVPPSLGGRIAGTIVFGVVALVLGAFADYLVLAILVLVGIALTAVTASLLGRRPRTGRVMLRWFHAADGLLVLACVGTIAGTTWLGWSPAYAIAAAAAAAAWTIAVWWLTARAMRPVLARDAAPLADSPEMV